MAKKSVTYDATIIHEFAQNLYSQAATIIFISTFLGVVIGALLGLVAAAAAKDQGAIGIAALIGAVIGGFAGFSRGRARAFELKLKAQEALCQVQIEKNTSATHN